MDSIHEDWDAVYIHVYMRGWDAVYIHVCVLSIITTNGSLTLINDIRSIQVPADYIGSKAIILMMVFYPVSPSY